MKKFEYGITTILDTEGYSDIEVAQDNFTYEITERKEYGAFDDEFTVIVTMVSPMESQKIKVNADQNIYLNELDDIIWEAIADFFVTEIK